MSEFIYHIHYQLGSKMGKADGLSRCWGEEKSAMETRSFDERQLVAHEGDDVEEREDADDVELEAIDVTR